jgi:hypothetical protein
MNWGRILKKALLSNDLTVVSLSNGAGLRLIEINGMLFALLKGRAQQKRHQPPPDKASWLSSEAALYPHKYTNLLVNSR